MNFVIDRYRLAVCDKSARTMSMSMYSVFMYLLSLLKLQKPRALCFDVCLRIYLFIYASILSLSLSLSPCIRVSLFPSNVFLVILYLFNSLTHSNFRALDIAFPVMASFPSGLHASALKETTTHSSPASSSSSSK